MRHLIFLPLFLLSASGLPGIGQDAKETGDALWVAKPLTQPGAFTAGIEGPVADLRGNVYAVNFHHEGTIGKVTPSGSASVFAELPKGSVGNGIRFAPDGSFYVADYTKHNILRVWPGGRKIEVHAHNPEMNQPNDLTTNSVGVLYASDPNWKEGTGQIWRIDPDGTTTRVAKDMGTTNGIEVSPDDHTLYVNESKQRNIWAFTIQDDGSLADKRLLRKFDDFGFDGMRCDISGNLYVTRHGKGTVVKLSPEGEILREIPVPGKRPSNICFGGPRGMTAYVTEAESGRLISFRVDLPGRAWQWHKANARRGTSFSSPDDPLIIAHRGASHDAPENTLAAFRLAFKQDASGVEGDFYLTKDKRIVCIHDKNTKRVSDKNLTVANSTLAELKRLDVGSWKDTKFRGERIPTIQEVMAVIPRDKNFVIELKVGPEIVAPLREALAASNLRPSQCLIISFNADTIAEAKLLMPRIKAHWLFKRKQKGDQRTPDPKAVAEKLHRIAADGYGVHGDPKAFNDRFVGLLGTTYEQIGLRSNTVDFQEFHVWTINDPKTASYYEQLGARAITTDRPGYIRKALADLKKAASEKK